MPVTWDSDKTFLEKRKVRGTRAGSDKSTRISEADTEAALLAASASELGYDPEEEKRLVDLYDRTIQSIRKARS